MQHLKIDLTSQLSLFFPTQLSESWAFQCKNVFCLNKTYLGPVKCPTVLYSSVTVYSFEWDFHIEQVFTLKIRKLLYSINFNVFNFNVAIDICGKWPIVHIRTHINIYLKIHEHICNSNGWKEIYVSYITHFIYVKS